VSRRPSSSDLVERVQAGERAAVARLISRSEHGEAEARQALGKIYRLAGRSHVIGITGVPGSGKSTLVGKLTEKLRAKGGKIGVIAVDPSSPYSGGAILGDRIRMSELAGDAGVFIRSMATHGATGGMAHTTLDAVDILDVAGFDTIIIETVGVGQDEVDIIRTADVSVVTLVPGTGDDVQALKAGIMEIADVFVVNKADREGADRLVSAVEATLSLHPYAAGEWRPPILRTTATTGQGVAELEAAVFAFRQHQTPEHAGRRRSRSAYRLRELVAQRFASYLDREVLKPGEFDAIVDRVAAREIDPYSAADDLLRRARGR
jgi:LAO/AO transport system kinase